jgi:hypothetical protein
VVDTGDVPGLRRSGAACLVSQAEYGRRRNISREAVRKRTVTAGGPIPVHGPRKQIDVAEADALWDATKTPQGEGGATSGGRSPQVAASEGAPVVDAGLYARAKTDRMIALAKREQLELRVREAELVDRQAAERQVEALAQQVRDEWRRWPSRVAPVIAQRLGGLPLADVLDVLDELVQRQAATLMPAVRLDGHRR